MEVDVKEYLSEVWYVKAEYNRLAARIRELEVMATKCTSSLSGLPKGGSADKEKLWIRLAEESKTLFSKQEEYFKQLDDVEKFLDLIPNKLHREVLKLRYLENMKWPELIRHLEATGAYYSPSAIFKIHGIALESARAIWKETHKT